MWNVKYSEDGLEGHLKTCGKELRLSIVCFRSELQGTEFQVAALPKFSIQPKSAPVVYKSTRKIPATEG
jgi:hypothetical protein